MKAYIDRSKEELLSLKEELTKKYDEYKSLNLSLNMMRGNPAPEQLDLSNKLFENFDETGFTSADGSDCRNYGVPFGLTEVRQLFADILDTEMENVIVGNSSSLNMMFDTLMRACAFGEVDSDKAWFQIEGRKWLCPVPGYDRHFKVTQQLGFDLIPVPMTENGPDMDIVEKLVSEDDKILGMWCIPVYSNPDGYVYSKETCERLCSMKTAANDFRIFWDNAYCVHYLKDAPDRILNILDECKKTGKEDMVFIFASTSKISFPGAGVAVMAGSVNNMKQVAGLMGIQCISYDKINQLRHVKYFKDMDGIMAHMAKHKEILAPKFNMVLDMLDKELGTVRKSLSSMVESRSWGFCGADFINCAVLYESDIDPLELLKICKKIEKCMGRNEQMEYASDGSRIYHDRIIDIDIILSGEQRIDLPDLVVPHPRMREREFVMGPLMEIFH